MKQQPVELVASLAEQHADEEFESPHGLRFDRHPVVESFPWSRLWFVRVVLPRLLLARLLI